MKTNAIVRIVLWSLVIVILLGLLTVGLGLRWFRFGGLSPSRSVEEVVIQDLNPGSESYGTPTAVIPAEEISRISINWVSGKVTIFPDDVTEITILDETPDSKYPTVFKLRNGKLTIDFSETKSFNGFGLNVVTDVLCKDLTIQVPRDFVLEELELDAASTDLEVHDMAIREVDIDSASGCSTFIGCDVEKLDVDSASGDVIFKGSLEELNFDAASASFRGVLTNVPSQVEMDSMSGALDLTLPSDAGFAAKVDGMSAKFNSEFDTTNRNGSYTHGNGHCRIDVDGMNCDVNIRCGENTALPFGTHHAEEGVHHAETEPHHLETEPHHEVTEPHHTENEHHS